MQPFQSSKVPQFVELLPTNESQCRLLTALEPDTACEVWQKAVEKAGGKVPSGRIVKDIVELIKQKEVFLQDIESYSYSDPTSHNCG